MQCNWAEDDFDVPPGVGRLGLSAPFDNRKYVMYHGTTRAIAQSIQATGFCQSADGMLGRGVYLSRDLLKASQDLARLWLRHRLGAPQLWDGEERLEEDCVWDPSRITISKIIKPKSFQMYGARGYM
ncbi:putative RNA 2'-phosphotransferase [Dissostichus eleginoides]|uniref:RNA 2'-phosphotransferase n=1 Tax=Dissostichus eleginoides TaxID=100907 RepID=A0AAD9EUF9_DISEL|nr:putative RNA 2'-phosphotransferase [Dissostichus eleginoides]